MAFVFDRAFVKFTFYDNQGKNASTHRRWQISTIADETDVEAFITELDTLIPIVQAITGAVVTDVSVEYNIVNNAVTLPATGVENENTADVQIQLVDITKSARVNIPAAVSGVFTATSGDGAKVVDITDTDLNAFVDYFKGTGQLMLSDEEFASASNPIIGGVRLHKRSPKGRTKRAG